MTLRRLAIFTLFILLFAMLFMAKRGISPASRPAASSGLVSAGTASNPMGGALAQPGASIPSPAANSAAGGFAVPGPAQGTAAGGDDQISENVRREIEAL